MAIGHKLLVLNEKNKRKKTIDGDNRTLIWPSVPVAAATIPVPPFGNLAYSLPAYILSIF
jgi:hypothetical protein